MTFYEHFNFSKVLNKLKLFYLFKNKDNKLIILMFFIIQIILKV